MFKERAILLFAFLKVLFSPFVLADIMDNFDSAGNIPVCIIKWRSDKAERGTFSTIQHRHIHFRNEFVVLMLDERVSFFSLFIFMEYEVEQHGLSFTKKRESKDEI